MAGPGPVTLGLGGFVFTALGFGYQGIERRHSAPWASLELVGRPEALQWLGPKSDEITISGVLFPVEFGGMDTLEGLHRAMDAGEAMMFVSRSGRIYGRHVLEEISEDRSLHLVEGLPMRLGYSLSLRRHDAGIGGGAMRLF
ncbi:MAG: phage tail protein [Pseudomonadota bacterium]